MALNIAGVIVLIVFYIITLIVGIVAAKKFKKSDGTTQTEVSVVAGRQLNSVVGLFTMTATLVGGGFINGTAESVYTSGLAWTLAPFGICVGLILGGLFFAKKMREEKYLTMLDPFQQRYGDLVTGLLYITAVFGDVLWSASILAALGTSLSVIIGVDVIISIIVSACIAIAYTLFGQMVSVAYTDIIQLVFIVVGLVISVPFAITNEAAGDVSKMTDNWLGSIELRFTAVWIDLLITMTLGSIPWQSYFQRVLSVKGAREAQIFSVAAGVGALLLAVPPILIGAVGASANWTMTSLGQSPMDLNQSSIVLPMVLNHLTPPAVAIIGLGAICAAVMSSTDSAILGSSSMFTYNVYRKLRTVCKGKASEKELLWVQRGTIFVIGAASTLLAIVTPSLTIYGLFILAADIVFVIIMPQLVCVLYFKKTNAYGALCGYVLAIMLRFGAGEPIINLPNFIYYPYFNEVDGQLFPFRTFAMIVSLNTSILVSYVVKFVFDKSNMLRKLDIFEVSEKIQNYDLKETSFKEQTSESEGKNYAKGQMPMENRF